MQGSIQKRVGKRGVSWTVVYDDPTAFGKRKQRRRTFRTKREAEAFLAKTIHQINTGGFIEPSTVTVGEYFEMWMTTYAQHNVRPTTYQSMQRQISVHIVPSLGGIKLQKLQPAHLQTFYANRLELGRADGKQGGLAPSSVNYLHRLIREALQQAMKWGLVPRNVADATEPPRAVHKQPQAWSSEQVSAFLALVTVTDDYYNPIWHLALSTGMRRGELLGLRWQDVDFDHGVLRVRQNLVEVSGKPAFQEPKSKAGRRVVALFPETVEELRMHRTRQIEHRLRIGPAWEDHDLVFANEVGAPIYPSNVNRHFRKLLHETGLPTIGFHGLRHTHATMLLKEGVHLKITSERLGHASVSLTADTYSHVLPDMQRDALDRIDASIFRRSKEPA